MSNKNVSLWRTDTHWFRPIRLTDEARFIADMERGWKAVGALPKTMDDICRDLYEEAMRDQMRRMDLLGYFLDQPEIVGQPIVYPVILKHG